MAIGEAVVCRDSRCDSTIWKDQSPSTYADNFSTPMMITIGEKDYRVPVNQSIAAWTYLKRKDVPGKLLVFHDANHWIMKGEEARYFWQEVQAWLAQNATRIRLFFLPGYSPELNPDEVLNQDVKSNAVGRVRARNQQELVKNVRGFLRSRQRQPRIVRKYFQEEHIRYAAI